MTLVTALLAVVVLLTAINLLILYRLKSTSKSDLQGTPFAPLGIEISKIDSLIREEFSRNRAEIQNTGKDSRVAIGATTMTDGPVDGTSVFLWPCSDATVHPISATRIA